MGEPEPEEPKACARCERPGCLHFRGGRSEAAYLDCLAHTAELARQLRIIANRAKNNADWAAIWSWMDEHKEQIYKNCFDANGRLEVELAVAKEQVKEAERDRERALNDNLDLHCAKVEYDSLIRKVRGIQRVGTDFDEKTGKDYQLCACGWVEPFESELCGNAAHVSSMVYDFRRQSKVKGEQLRKALRDAKIPHGPGCLEANTGRSPWKCVCIAEKHNAAIDAVLEYP